MKNPTFDKIIASRPVNKQTAISNSGGVSYEPPDIHSRKIYDAPPKMKDVPIDAPNLIGVKFGKLTVVGLQDKPQQRRGASWVVKCVCGKYETRHAKAIRNEKNIGDCCKHCYNNIRLKQKECGSVLGMESYYKIRNDELLYNQRVGEAKK